MAAARVRTPSPSPSQTSQGSNGSTSRRSRKLSDDQEDTLCVWLAANPYLWDMKEHGYRNTKAKAEAWRKQAACMGLTVDHIQGAFKNLRDWNNSIDKQIHKSGAGQAQLTARQKTVVDRMKFLQRTVSHRPAPIRSIHSQGPVQDRTVIASVDDSSQSTPRSSKKKKKSQCSEDSEVASDISNLLTTARQSALSLAAEVSSISRAPDTNDENFEKKSFLQFVLGQCLNMDTDQYDRFQQMFWRMNQEFKAERRQKQAQSQGFQQVPMPPPPPPQHYQYPTTAPQRLQSPPQPQVMQSPPQVQYHHTQFFPSPSTSGFQHTEK